LALKQGNEGILEMLQQESAKAARRALRALIIQPGALGDCVLTLPLADFLKRSLKLGSIDLLAHLEYVGFYPNRTCIDTVRSIDAIDMHRLFTDAEHFQLMDRDPLIQAFSDYAWIVSFMGSPESPFESNLTYTVHCSHSAEVLALPLKPPVDMKGHVSRFYCERFVAQCDLSLDMPEFNMHQRYISPTHADRELGLEILGSIDIDRSRPLLVLHPGSGGRAKCWMLDNFLGIARAVQDRDWNAVFLMGPAESERWTEAQRRGLEQAFPVLEGVPLGSILAVLSLANGFVGNDSGISHLAGAMGVRSFAAFGPTNPQVYHPLGERVEILHADTERFQTSPSPALQKKVLDSLLK